MRNMHPPKVDEVPRVPVLEKAEQTALIAACAGTDFEARRDTAIIRAFLGTGARLAEMAGLELTDDPEVPHIDLEDDALYVLGKGRRGRFLPLAPKALRPRTDTSAPGALTLTRPRRGWIGRKGRLTAGGIAEMIGRRGEQAGIEDLHPHVFRHTFAHQWLAKGGNEGDLMRLTGWRTREMLQRYGASAADENARDTHRRIATGRRPLMDAPEETGELVPPTDSSRSSPASRSAQTLPAKPNSATSARRPGAGSRRPNSPRAATSGRCSSRPARPRSDSTRRASSRWSSGGLHRRHAYVELRGDLAIRLPTVITRTSRSRSASRVVTHDSLVRARLIRSECLGEPFGLYSHTGHVTVRATIGVGGGGGTRGSCGVLPRGLRP